MATPTSSYASVFMLATDQPVMALGSYQGWDRILTPDQLAALVKEGTVRFLLSEWRERRERHRAWEQHRKRGGCERRYARRHR